MFVLGACSPSSLEDFREEGEGITRSLIQDLKQCHTRDDLVSLMPKLKNRFNAMVEIIIEAHEWQKIHGGEQPELSKENHLISDQLREELNRVCRIEGGRELIEKCQEDSLERLDAYLKISK